jgi:hypothetical protein
LRDDELHALHFSPNILEQSNGEEEVGKACGIYGGEWKKHKKFCLVNLKKEISWKA